MDNKFGKDLTVGSIPKHLLAFSIPMLLGNLLQTGYSIVNMIWVGNIVGENGVGATAVSFPVMFILIGIAVGGTMATSVLVAQNYGAKNYERMTKVVNNSVTLFLILSVTLTTVLVLCSDLILRLMDTPAEIFAMASGYLKISLAGLILMIFMFLISSILRGIGDTVTPLYFMGCAVIINAILDPLLIIGIRPFPKLGLNGAAYASIISQGIALTMALIYLNRKNHFVTIKFSTFGLDKQLTLLILKIGFPSMIQQTLISIGTAFVTTYVNSFGAPTIAAFGAANRIDMVATMPAIAIGMAVTALTGQNLGAGKPERVKEIFKWGVIIGTSISGTIAVISVAFPQIILSMFIHHQSVLDIGTTYLRIVGPGYLFLSLMFVAQGVVNGAGQTMITMVFSLLTLWAIRVPVASYLSRTSLGSTGIWIAIAASFVIGSSISWLYYCSGRWKKAASKIQSSAIMMPEPME